MQNKLIGRRGFLAGAAAAGALGLVARSLPFAYAADAPAAGKPNSVINGVHIGAITYSYRDMKLKTAEETLKALLDSGLSECELMDGPINAYIGYTGKATDKEREGMLKKAADLKKLY